jgi:hypothetical protein
MSKACTRSSSVTKVSLLTYSIPESLISLLKIRKFCSKCTDVSSAAFTTLIAMTLAPFSSTLNVTEEVINNGGHLNEESGYLTFNQLFECVTELR